MSTSRSRSFAFTLVELLVVIAIIGVLTALLIPAVQQAREAGRRSTCTNNLKQIGLAFQCYESAYHVLPPAYISDKNTAVGWGVYLLPYIEMKTMYDQYNFRVPFYYGYPANTGNQLISNTPIACFQCPSAPINKPYTYTDGTDTWQACPADYSPIARVHEALDELLGLGYKEKQRLGILQPDKSTPVSAISDGTSHTILVAEIAGKNDLWQNGKNTYQKLSGTYGGQGGWADPTSAKSVLIGTKADCVIPGEFGVNTSNDTGLYAFHRVLANALMADGSVRSISEDIEILPLIGLVTRAGGEIEK